MVRRIAGLPVLLVFLAGLAVAAQDTRDRKKDGKQEDFPWEYGSFESYKNEILTLKVDKKLKEYKVPGDIVVGYSTGKKEDKVTMQKAKEHLKDVKKGSIVTITFDREGKKVVALGVIVSDPPKGKSRNKDEESDK